MNLKTKIPIRTWVAVQMFLACFISYMLRVNMSMNIIAMVENAGGGKKVDTECGVHTNETFNETKTLPNYGPRYKWSSKDQGLILGAYFWGYIITEIPGGFLSEQFGPAKVTLYSSILASVLTIITPFFAPLHYMAVFIIRFLLGVVAGVLYPALHCLTAHWSPPDEKGRFVAALLGGQIGTVVTWGILGVIIQNVGWIWGFIIPGAFSLLWCFSWWLMVTDVPEDHRWIGEEEIKYIAEKLEGRISTEKKIPPYLDFFKSIKYWSLIVLHFGNLWGLYLLLTSGPKYMNEALGYDIKKSGILASLPYLARFILGIVFGSLGDIIRKRRWMSVTFTRKIFTIFSHVIPALLLYSLMGTGCNAIAAVALITFSLGSNGASTLTNLQNHQDLAPNYAGSLYGIMNAIGGTTGFITPAIIGYITEEKSGLQEWRLIFAIGGSIYLGSAIIFMIFGTGKEQKFNKRVGGKRKEGVDNPGFSS